VFVKYHITAMNTKIPFDKLWKSATEEFFEDFLWYFLPELAEQVDFSIAHEFLEQELKAAVADKNTKSADKLVKIKLKNGQEKWIFVHIEFENSAKKNIGERMYGYHSRIREKFGKEITAIVVFTGRHIPKNSTYYKHEVFGTTIFYKFNSYAIVKQDAETLKADQNPFAIVVLANLYVLLTYKNDQKRLELKQQIYNIARERGYPDDKTHRLILFLTELVKLPKYLEAAFKEYITEPQKSTNTMYTTQVSRDIADAFAKQTYGKTFAEMDATIISAITRLYEKMQFSIDQIADTLQLEKEAVVVVLKKYKLIKK
jgi:hypothetical protein